MIAANLKLQFMKASTNINTTAYMDHMVLAYSESLGIQVASPY